MISAGPLGHIMNPECSCQDEEGCGEGNEVKSKSKKGDRTLLKAVPGRCFSRKPHKDDQCVPAALGALRQ